MKKILSMLLALTMATSLVACGGEEKESQNNNSVTEKEQTETTDEEENIDEKQVEESESSEGIKYADMIPDPEEIFKNGEISIVDQDGGKAYILQVRNYTAEEYDTFVSGCKDMGFSDIKYDETNDGGKMFGAYTADGEYWVEALLGNESGIVSITCKQSTRK